MAQILYRQYIVMTIKNSKFSNKTNNTDWRTSILRFDTENDFLRKCTVNLLKPTGYVIN